jgi:putative intracellular protease/amidase
MQRFIRILKRALLVLSYLLAGLAPILLGAGLGAVGSLRAATPPIPADVAGAVKPWPAPPYDPARPTVAIVLGEISSEVTDVLGPYAMFARSGAYNVYAVAASRAPHTLSGGLDVVPHFTLAELDALLGGDPAIIVTPAMQAIGDAANAPLLAWLRQHAAGTSIMFSWCTGAEVLAAAGLLDGHAATAHWGDLGSLEGDYPNVRWQRGVRYVDEGKLITSAGLTSGIDATLHLLGRLHGHELADRLAADMGYPSAHFAAEPAMEQYEMGGADNVYLFNLAFYWPKQRLGVWLGDGVDELELAAVFDIYTASWTSQSATLGASASVRSLNGLQLVPRWTAPQIPAVDRVLVFGEQAAGAELALAGRPDTALVGPDPSRAGEFVFERALERFDAEGNGATARFAARRLEYRAESLELAGGGWPLRVIGWPLLLGGLGIALRWAGRRWWRGRRRSA